MTDRPTVVLCDDAPGFRALMSALLEEAGLTVTGRGETWEDAERLAPGADAIVVDLWMPELELETLARIRAASPDATLAVVSALDPEEARQKVDGLGVDLVLAKTAPPSDVAAAIAAHARGDRAPEAPRRPRPPERRPPRRSPPAARRRAAARTTRRRDRAVEPRPLLPAPQLLLEPVERAEAAAEVVDHVHERGLARAGHDRAAVGQRPVVAEDDVAHRARERLREAGRSSISRRTR